MIARRLDRWILHSESPWTSESYQDAARRKAPADSGFPDLPPNALAHGRRGGIEATPRTHDRPSPARRRSASKPAQHPLDGTAPRTRLPAPPALRKHRVETTPFAKNRGPRLPSNRQSTTPRTPCAAPPFRTAELSPPYGRAPYAERRTQRAALAPLGELDRVAVGEALVHLVPRNAARVSGIPDEENRGDSPSAR